MSDGLCTDSLVHLFNSTPAVCQELLLVQFKLWTNQRAIWCYMVMAIWYMAHLVI